MIAFDAALEIVADALIPVGAERVPLSDVAGRTLSEDLVARRTQPPRAVSAMDGFAVRAADVRPGSPLRLAGEARAGAPTPDKLGPGEAIAISTGAALPSGADQVVMRERAVVTDGEVTLDAAPEVGAFVRPAGLDFAEGDTVLADGDVMTPERTGLAAAAGVSWACVRRRPVLRLLCTGDELVEPGAAHGDHQIIDTASVSLTALFESFGACVRYGGIVPDDAATVRDAFQKASDADLIVTVGGASVGDHDHLKPAIRTLGGTLLFERVAAKPGKPTWFARLTDGRPVLGLPGNPVSALIMGRLFGAAATAALLGRRNGPLAFHDLALAQDLPANGERETFLRARSERGEDGLSRVRALDNQDSSALTALAAADIVIRRPAGAPAAGIGDLVPTLRLSEG